MTDAATDGLLNEIARLLALQIRLGLDTQKEAILALHESGFSNTRIGELLGTTSATARATVHAAKK